MADIGPLGSAQGRTQGGGGTRARAPSPYELGGPTEAGGPLEAATERT